MNSRGIPAYFLDSRAEIFTETHAPGAMGEPVVKLRSLATAPCRADHKGTRRESGDIHESPAEYKVYLNGGMKLTALNWMKITLPDGRVIIGQVTFHKDPASAGHHTETTLVQRDKPPDILP